MAGCEHNVDLGFDYPCVDCVALTPEQEAIRLHHMSIQLNPRTVTPSSMNNLAPEGTNGRNSWERGFATDHRGLPYITEDGTPIGVKNFADNRSKYEEKIRKHKTVGV